MGGEGKAVEADETLSIASPAAARRPAASKNAVLFIDRRGAVRSFHIDKVGVKEIGDIAKNFAPRKRANDR